MSLNLPDLVSLARRAPAAAALVAATAPLRLLRQAGVSLSTLALGALYASRALQRGPARRTAGHARPAYPQTQPGSPRPMTLARLLPAPMRGALLRGIRITGYDLVPSAAARARLPPDIAREARFVELYERCRPFTMTSPERMFAQYMAVQHVVRHNVPGSVVECGVWKGGSSMMAALALIGLGDTSRDLYLYDTFEGMPEPGERDVGSYTGVVATEKWRDSVKGEVVDWCFSPLDEVRRNLAATGYPAERIHFVQGKVEDTLPATLPEAVALLRLDTDWYESTYHELLHLYPCVSPNGVVIIDDYGYWEGAREATDAYLAETGEPLLLSRIDVTGRMAIKPPR